MAHMDSTAYQVLIDQILELEKSGINVILTNLIGPTRDFLERAGFNEVVGKNRQFLDIQSGIDFYDKELKNINQVND